MFGRRWRQSPGLDLRLIVGTALVARGGHVCPAWGVGNNAPADAWAGEIELERRVSAVIGRMYVLWSEIDDEPGPESLRGYIERSAIALLSNYGKAPLDAPSAGWLGHSCNRGGRMGGTGTRPEPKSKLLLRFQNQAALRHVEDPVEQDLSAAARWEECLFVSCDETAGVERLTAADGCWGDHRHFALGELVDLPAGPDGEMDIEGLSCDDGWLWVVGSHALKRDKPKAEDPAEGLREMCKIDRDSNRYFLGRFPLERGEAGLAPVAESGERRAEHLRLHKNKSKLLKWLKDDPHLAPFLDIPSKENGLDIEGIAARGLRIWLGLRGPVLRGWAVILELELERKGDGRLTARTIDGDRRYRKHLLPTGGLGVRDLAFDGDDLLVLAGPTLATEGPARVLRWRDAANCRTGGVRSAEAAPRALELPYHGPVDHPEGLVAWEEGWLVVYDSPSERRLEGEGATVTADVWEIP